MLRKPNINSQIWGAPIVAVQKSIGGTNTNIFKRNAIQETKNKISAFQGLAGDISSMRTALPLGEAEACMAQN
jgi:hypothetical protein